jgi:hypothetical protein
VPKLKLDRTTRPRLPDRRYLGDKAAKHPRATISSSPSAPTAAAARHIHICYDLQRFYILRCAGYYFWVPATYVDHLFCWSIQGLYQAGVLLNSTCNYLQPAWFRQPRGTSFELCQSKRLAAACSNGVDCVQPLFRGLVDNIKCQSVTFSLPRTGARSIPWERTPALQLGNALPATTLDLFVVAGAHCLELTQQCTAIIP